MFKKVLVANRGVIAVRIQKACQMLGIKTIAVYTPDDEESTHVKIADECCCISAYNEIPEILAVAERYKADAIHPGVGFLSENPDFVYSARRYATVIGPSLDVVALMGNKIEAKQIAQQANVPCIPGSQGAIISEKKIRVKDKEIGLYEFASQIGYPLMLKASCGGAGLGIATVYNERELIPKFRLVQAQAKELFKSQEIFIERLIEPKRHIEVQILGDHYGNIIHLGERDCSLQRTNQKLLEFSPASIDARLRYEMAQSAVRLARQVRYTNAGTIEFLVDQNGNYYFMEANTRIQVEHRVTEMITGIDLVAEQIKIAAGERLSYAQSTIPFHGFSLECRINAEDPDEEFQPCPGLVQRFIPPEGAGIIIDTFVPTVTAAGSFFQISSLYDSLLANVIAHGKDKKEAVARMKEALQAFVIEGDAVKTTIPYLLRKLEEF